MKNITQSVQDRQQVDNIAKTLSKSIEEFCEKAPFDLRCIDWFSYNPDFHIKQQNRKTA